jgi:hypothetical protein
LVIATGDMSNMLYGIAGTLNKTEKPLETALASPANLAVLVAPDRQAHVPPAETRMPLRFPTAARSEPLARTV